MGLDGVEMVMQLEERFAIQISDADAEICTTPRHLIDLIFGKLQTKAAPGTCLSQHLFYRMRRSFSGVVATSRNDFKRDIELSQLLPRSCRRDIWQQIEKEFGGPLPELIRPDWCKFLSPVCALATIAALPGYTPIWMQLSIGFGTFALFQVVTKPIQREFPKGLETIEQLIGHLTADRPAKFQRAGCLWSREQVAARVNRIVAEQLDLAPGSFTENSRFVEDLGMD